MILRWCLILLSMLPLTANAVIQFEIVGGSDAARPIAIVPFAWNGTTATPLQMADIISADLNRSGQFKTLAPADMLEKPTQANQINFKNWRALGIQHVAIGRLLLQDGQYVAEFQLFDVATEKQLLGHRLPAKPDRLVSTSHAIADLIYEAITGTKGAFNTRIAYIEAVSEAGVRKYILQVADSDGRNPRTILKSRQPMMSVAWSPDGRKLVYVSFENRRPEIFLQDVATAAREKLAGFAGINGAPRFSPDGQQLALTLSYGGNPDIYVLNVKTKAVRQLTRNGAIDTEPVWTKDGQDIIFTSGRSGAPQLYQMPVSDGDARAKRITFEGNYNASASLSPDGKSLAFITRDGSGYHVGVLDRARGFLRVLTRGKLDESPSFAPNGAMLLYATEYRGRGVLATVSIDGRVQQRFSSSEGDIREPTWGPFITD